MKISQQIFKKRWKPILEEYEKIQNRVPPVPSALLKNRELSHINLTKIPKDIRTVFKVKNLYVAASVEAFRKIIKNEFFHPNLFDSIKDIIYNLGNFLFEYNHLKRHGGLAYINITPYEKLEKVTELLN